MSTTEKAREVLRAFGFDENGGPDFAPAIEEYLAEVGSLAARYRAARDLARIPVTKPDGGAFALRAGGQNVLIKAVAEESCPFRPT